MKSQEAKLKNKIRVVRVHVKTEDYSKSCNESVVSDQIRVPKIESVSLQKTSYLPVGSARYCSYHMCSIITLEQGLSVVEIWLSFGNSLIESGSLRFIPILFRRFLLDSITFFGLSHKEVIIFRLSGLDSKPRKNLIMRLSV